MPLGWDDTALAQLEGGKPRTAVFVRIGSVPAIRVWAGIGDFALPADTVETTAGAIYSGMGELSGFPALQQVINGQADRLDLTVAGSVLTQEMLELASTHASAIRGAIANIGVAVLGRSLQLVSPVAWLCDIECDVLGVARENGENGDIRSITVSGASVTSGRRRARFLQWTDVDQKRQSAGDRFCEMVASYNAGTTRVWPV